eukprot:scaffold5598_cov60-Attheya_sp.AAC.2
MANVDLEQEQVEDESSTHEELQDVELAVKSNSTTTAPPTSSVACHLRWTRIAKTVELHEATVGLLRGSIGHKNPQNDSTITSTTGGPTMKVILNQVSGEARPGEILALMGPSGSGKTSLLDALSGRSAYESGTLTINGIVAKGSAIKQLKRKIAYIKQADIFFGHLTVRDQLTYTALLRLPSEWPKTKKYAEVDRIIEMLRLGKCADTPIRLVSGGERKRVNIGSELLTDPSIIMLDEPTSGLDSSSASALLSILIDLARKGGKTVVTSIHQPNSSAFRKFDRLMLLADGCTVYYGTPMDSLHYLGNLGFDCPAGYNAADHWMDLLVEDSAFDGGTMHSRKSSVPAIKSKTSSDYSDLEKEQPKDQATPDLGTMRRKSSILNLKSQKTNRRASSQILLSKARAVAINSDTPKASLIEAWDNDGTAEALEKEETKGFTDESETAGSALSMSLGSSQKKYNSSWFTQFTVLSHRSLKNSRSAIFTPLNIIKSVALGVMSGLLWFQMPYTELTVVDRSSFFFFTMTFWVFDAMFGALFAFPSERAIIFKVRLRMPSTERASGAYRLSAYFMAKTLSEAPTRLILPLVYMIIAYWMVGANPSFVVFLATTGITLMSVMSGESIGLLIGAMVLDAEKALVVMVVISLCLMVAGGFYVSNVPSFLIWLQYLSPFKYSYDAALPLVFDRDMPCDGSGVLEAVCGGEDTGYATPDEIIDFLGVQGSVGFNVGMLFVLIMVPRLFAFWALRRQRGGERT